FLLATPPNYCQKGALRVVRCGDSVWVKYIAEDGTAAETCKTPCGCQFGVAGGFLRAQCAAFSADLLTTPQFIDHYGRGSILPPPSAQVTRWLLLESTSAR